MADIDTEALRAAPEKDGALRFPDPFIAVFNGHWNRAAERALAICMRRYSDDDDKSGMAAYRDGIMAIFNSKPTPAAETFAHCCFAFANEPAPDRDRLLRVAEAAREHRAACHAVLATEAVPDRMRAMKAMADTRDALDAALDALDAKDPAP